MSEHSSKATRLLERALAILSAQPAPLVLRAYEHLGITPALLAEILGVNRREVTAWYRRQRDIPDEHRLTMLAYLSALLVWLFGAENHVVAPASPFWRQRTEVARRLLDAELRASPALAHRVHALADEIDGLVRHEAVRIAVGHRERAHRTLQRSAHHVGRRRRTPPGVARWREPPPTRPEATA